MGHLAWDSYEPSEGKFDFDWFDKVMDMMNLNLLKSGELFRLK
jgi:beta-galactosidase GanA